VIATAIKSPLAHELRNSKGMMVDIKTDQRQLAEWFVSLVRAIQPQRWTKLVVIYAALVFDGKLFQPNLLLGTTLIVLAFCLAAGSISLLNHCIYGQQRQRPQLRTRLGESLGLRTALVVVMLLALLSLGISIWLDTRVGLVTAVYLLVNIAYHFYLKSLVIIDVLVLVLGSLLGVFAGAIFVDVEKFSPWLYICVTLLASFLGFAKRRHELTLWQDAAIQDCSVLAHYSLPLIDQIIGLVTTSMLLTYTLYTFGASTALTDDGRLLLTTPFVFYFVVRYFYLIHVKKIGGAPDELLWKDKPLLVNSLLWVSAIVGLIYIG